MLNLTFAWISTVFILLLLILYPLKIYFKTTKARFILNKIHKPLGIIVIPLIFFHCRFSSQNIALNTGTICLFIVILLFFTYIFRKKLKKFWIKFHRILAIILLITLFSHIYIAKFTNLNF